MADIEKQTTQAPAILPVGEQTYDPSSESPSLGSDSGITKRNSREKEQAVHDATLAHELAEDDLEVHNRKAWRTMEWSFWRKIMLPLWAAVVCGWWAASIAVEETRHRWIQSTIIAWFIILNVLFCFVDSNIFGAPIGRAWTSCVSVPWFKLPRMLRFTLGWLLLLGLVFGSAFGFPLPEATTYGQRAISVFGLFIFQCIYYLCSRNRKLVKWNTVIVGLVLQQAIAMFVLKTSAGFDLFKWIALAAADFLKMGGRAGVFFWDESFAGYFAIGTLSAVIFFIAFINMLFYIGAMSWIIGKFAWLFFRAMEISGAEAVIAAASPFVGQGESACLVKPFVDLMTPSELHLSMTSGFSTISGSVLVGYINLGVPASSLITASIMSIPASIAISKVVYPEDDHPVTLGRLVVDRGEETNEEANMLHAFSNGASFGLKVAGLIFCNVLVVLALLYTVDGVLTWIGKVFRINELTLELIFQYIFYPLAWLMGVPNQDLLLVGQLLGLKLFGNEFVAYLALQTRMADPDLPAVTQRGYLIATYSLAGFANLGSLGIQIGVLSGLAPSRAKIIAVIAPSALIFGFLSTCQTATIAGMMV
ncbi:Na+ dependent nucleoside transporter C-terminus-domain-containing protein [Mrakia frigida]|uniref:NupC/NupG family nucleoside CNT transporter n=1 Tax=Mrakia frigida TaxID=29902 RepID=UPI003FCC0ACA